MAKNKNLSAAKKAKNDEFYTRREDIEAELIPPEIPGDGLCLEGRGSGLYREGRHRPVHAGPPERPECG